MPTTVKQASVVGAQRLSVAQVLFAKCLQEHRWETGHVPQRWRRQGKTQSPCPCLHPEPLSPSVLVPDGGAQQAHSPLALPTSLGHVQVDRQTGPENRHCAFLG